MTYSFLPLREKSLNEIEGRTDAVPHFDSSVTSRLRTLRQRPIGTLSASDLRFLLGQRQGVTYLLPLALEQLATDPLDDCGLYPGALLLKLIDTEPYWLAGPPAPGNARDVLQVLAQALSALEHLLEPAIGTNDQDSMHDEFSRRELETLAATIRAATNRLEQFLGEAA